MAGWFSCIQPVYSVFTAGKDGLAFLTNGLDWAELAFFQDKRVRLGWALSGWSPVKKERARRFSLDHS